MIQIKVCGLTRAEDIALCLELGVDRLGFVLAPSSRRLTLEQLDRLLPTLPPGYPWVAVLVDPEPELVEDLLTRGCPAVQFHGSETPEFCARWRGRVRRVKALRLTGPEDLDRCADYDVEEFLLDGARPGHGQVFDWSWLADRRPGQPFFLAGGLHPENVAAAIAAARPGGVDVSSGVEASPGCKDPEKLKAFLERSRKHNR